MLQDFEGPLPAPSPAAISSVEGKTTGPVCNDSRQPEPATSFPDGSDLISPLPEAKVVSQPSSHRRANTEIIPRQARLPVRQLFADQSRTLEDLENKGSPPENTARGKLGERAKLLSDWFQGKSEPVNFSLTRQPSTRAMDNSEKELNSLTRLTPPSPLKQVSTPNTFSFFGLKRQGESREELPEPADDELLNLDITAALFPPGSSGLNDQETFSALRNNADTIIRRLQAAYKHRTFALHEAMADKTEKQEELEETKTRMEHLKMQLDGMAEKVLQQDKAMKAMAEELEQERQLRQRESEAHRHSVMLVKSADDDTSSDLGTELRAPNRSLKRASNCTLTSDSGWESGDESIADSVFSQRDGIGSPRSTITVPSPNMSQATLSTPTSTPIPTQKDTKTPAAMRPSAYDRVLKGLASTGLTKSRDTSDCANCHGVPASEAWSVMGVLKDENKGLKVRLGELEVVIDECLDVVR